MFESVLLKFEKHYTSCSDKYYVTFLDKYDLLVCVFFCYGTLGLCLTDVTTFQIKEDTQCRIIK